MKKIIVFAISILYVFSLVGCGEPKNNEVKKTIEGNMKTYCEMEDGTWNCNDIAYKYRLEIKGRMPNAVCDSVFVYLSNIENISFEQAWKASGLSSHMADYFDVDDAIEVLNTRYNEAYDADIESGSFMRLVIEDYDPLHPSDGTATYLDK